MKPTQNRKVIRCKHGANCIYMKEDNCKFYHPQEDYILYKDEEHYENKPKKLKLKMNPSSSIFLDIPSEEMVSALKDLKETYRKNYDVLRLDIFDIYDTIDSIKSISSKTSRKILNEQIFKTNEKIKNLIMNIVFSNKNKIKQEKTYNITSELMNKYAGDIKYLFRFIFGGPRFKNSMNVYEFDTSFWILQNMDLPMDNLNELLKSHGFNIENKKENQEKQLNLIVSCIDSK